jgi:hypothetical protein
LGELHGAVLLLQGPDVTENFKPAYGRVYFARNEGDQFYLNTAEPTLNGVGCPICEHSVPEKKITLPVWIDTDRKIGMMSMKLEAYHALQKVLEDTRREEYRIAKAGLFKRNKRWYRENPTITLRLRAAR